MGLLKCENRTERRQFHVEEKWHLVLENTRLALNARTQFINAKTAQALGANRQNPTDVPTDYSTVEANA
jgi:hypothetical protein